MCFRFLLLLAGLSAPLAGCLAGPETPEVGLRRPIVGGQAEDGYPAVGTMAARSSVCTATLIAPRVVISAKHCLHRGIAPQDVSFRTGPNGDHVVAAAIGLFYEGGLSGQNGEHADGSPDSAVNEYIDIVAVALDRAPALEPAPYYRSLLPESAEGDVAFIVGHGLTADDAIGDGRKRSGPTTIYDVQTRHPIIVTTRRAGEATGCYGDSGGPIFHDGRVAGVMSYHADIAAPCVGGGRYLQVAAFTTLVDQAERLAAETPAVEGGEGDLDGGRGGGDDSCESANDGFCDEPWLCPQGTDSTDCPVDGDEAGDLCFCDDACADAGDCCADCGAGDSNCGCDSWLDTGELCCDDGCACDVDCDDGYAACGATGGDGDGGGGDDECECDSWFDTDELCCDDGCACDTDCDGDLPPC